MDDDKSNGFEIATDEWEANDEWQFADRAAERRYFYEAGQRQSVAQAERNAVRECERIAHLFVTDENPYHESEIEHTNMAVVEIVAAIRNRYPQHFTEV